MSHDRPTRPPVRPWWVVTTYFAEGFPYSLVRQISTVFFKDAGASLQAIGLTSLYGLPWTLKFLWGPLVDTYATKRRWLVTAEAVLALLAFTMAAASAHPSALLAASVVFLLVALASATHDIAVDGYYLEALDRTQQARFVGFQAMSYRLALIAGGGGIVALSGLTSWPTAFTTAGGVLGLLFLCHALFLPRLEAPRRSGRELLHALLAPRVAVGAAVVLLAVWALQRLAQLEALAGLRGVLTRLSIPNWIVLGLFTILAVVAVRAPALKRRLYASQSTYALAFVDYLDQPRIGVILAFVALYRTGESFLLNMAYPFLRDIGVSRAAYGLAYGTFGIAASIAGGLVGGALIARWGLRRCIWPFVLSQNVLNLAYMFLALSYRAILRHPELGHADLRLVTALIVLEAFGAGLGTAAFMVFVMRTTKPAYKAANMAIATGLMSVSATMAGVFSGFLAEVLGFAAYFGFTFLATLPSMALIPFLPQLREANPPPRPPGDS
ncbi:MAG: MFS transporter [Thermoanaerobaculaceae bacterium]|nr:MFS transporter [Thermoanaerobaculaceae bacterium]